MDVNLLEVIKSYFKRKPKVEVPDIQVLEYVSYMGETWLVLDERDDLITDMVCVSQAVTRIGRPIVEHAYYIHKPEVIKMTYDIIINKGDK